MRLFSVYKMELYKMFKRRNSFLLLVPCVLIFLMTVGFVTGNMTFSGEITGLSCLDAFSVLWMMVSETGLAGIIILLVASFQFASEVENEQIKIMLLRVEKRGQIIAGKIMAMATVLILYLVSIFAAAAAGYYLFIGGSEIGNGAFGLTAELGISGIGMVTMIFATFCSFLILTVITYLLGLKLNMFLSFIITLIFMYAMSFISGLEKLSFLKYTSFYMESSVTMYENNGISQLLICFMVSVVLIGGGMYLVNLLFKKTDIK